MKVSPLHNKWASLLVPTLPKSRRVRHAQNGLKIYFHQYWKFTLSSQIEYGC